MKVRLDVEVQQMRTPEDRVGAVIPRDPALAESRTRPTDS
ncbi:MAG: hypothetical protein JWR64_2508, partial [Marmoricola sp.]|nr:hypothetical protein [Marmoricola sp.]